MKVNKFLLAGVAVLGLGMTACNDDDVPPVGNPAEGSTFAGMYISTMKDVITKAVIIFYSPYTAFFGHTDVQDFHYHEKVTPQAG